MQASSISGPTWPQRISARPAEPIRTILDIPVEAARIVHDTVTRTGDVVGAVSRPLAFPLRVAEAAMRPALAVGEVVADRVDALVHGVHPSHRFDSLQADDPAFLDDVFDDPHGWQTADNGEAIGRMKTLGRRGFSETRIEFAPQPQTPDDRRSPVERALGMLHEAWATERNGVKEGYKGTFELIEDHQSGEDAGKFEYYLFPTGKLPAVGGLRVHETQLRALSLSDGGLRVPIALEGGADGLAYIDLHPAVNGRVVLQGRFAGVEPGELGEMFGPRGYLTNHTLVERGDGNEIPLLGKFTPDNGGLLGMIKDRGWLILAPPPTSTSPPDAPPRLRDLPRVTTSIARDGLKELGDLFAEHASTAALSLPFKAGAAILSGAMATSSTIFQPSASASSRYLA